MDVYIMMIGLFQSTHPHGVRPGQTLGFPDCRVVSIHAPTRGATICGMAIMYILLSFNPRTHTGCDALKKYGLFHSYEGFQSTHPHGVRRFSSIYSRCVYSFNPRTHTGCDQDNGKLSEYKPWFQSTHPHGVRLMGFRVILQDRLGFNPRTHTGCDFLLSSAHHPWKSFNPRTHTGCDYQSRTAYLPPFVSIHAPTRGATAQKAHLYAFKEVCFNPRTHTGCDRRI